MYYYLYIVALIKIHLHTIIPLLNVSVNIILLGQTYLLISINEFFQQVQNLELPIVRIKLIRSDHNTSIIDHLIDCVVRHVD